jgi:hypothetical protein
MTGTNMRYLKSICAKNMKDAGSRNRPNRTRNGKSIKEGAQNSVGDVRF